MRNTPCIGRADPTFVQIIEAHGRWVACEWPERPLDGRNAVSVDCPRCAVFLIAHGVAHPESMVQNGSKARARYSIGFLSTAGETVRAMAAAGDRNAQLAVRRLEQML